jgi:hypothetical protein
MSLAFPGGTVGLDVGFAVGVPAPSLGVGVPAPASGVGAANALFKGEEEEATTRRRRRGSAAKEGVGTWRRGW